LSNLAASTKGKLPDFWHRFPRKLTLEPDSIATFHLDESSDTALGASSRRRDRLLAIDPGVDSKNFRRAS
jgi:hypothetical protein